LAKGKRRRGKKTAGNAGARTKARIRTNHTSIKKIAALRASRDFRLQLFDELPSPIWAAGTDAKCNYFNKSWLTFTGRTIEQELGDGWSEGVHPEDRDRCFDTYLQAFQARVPFEMEYRLRRHDGEYRWIVDAGRPFYAHSGSFTGYIGSCLDITERKRMEAALRESEERFRALYDDNPSMLFTVDADGTVLSVNQFGTEQLGYRVGELVGRSVLTVFHEEDRQKAMECLHVAFQAPTQVHQWELRKVRKDGRVLWVREDVRIIQDSAGKPLALVVCEDITERKRADEALRESEAFKNRILENSPDCIKVLDLEGRLLFMSKGGMESLEIHDAAPFLNRQWVEFWQGEYKQKARVAIEAARTGGVGRFLGFYPTATGKPKWWDVLITPLLDASGAPDKLLAISRDITERTRAQEALRASEERFDLAVQGSQEGLWDGHLLPGEPWHSPRTPVWWSPRVREMLGFTEEEFPNVLESWAKLLHPEDKERVVEALVAHIERKVPYEAEYRLRTKGGAYRWFRARGQALWDASGNAVRMAGNMQDITEHKRTDEALRLAEEQYRSIFENAVEGIFQTTSDGRYISANPALARLYGYESSREMIEAVTDIRRQVYVDPDRRNEFRRLLEEHDAVTGFEAQVYRKDGSVIWISESARAVRDRQGTLLCYEGTVEDITERKRLEQQLLQSQKMEAIGRLAGGVAHDFNNLLTAIMGYSELLLSGVGSEEVRRRNTGQIKKAAERAAALTRQLLAFSRRQVLTMKVLDLNDVVAAMEPMLRRLIGEDLTLVTVLDRALERTKADVGQIEQVIMNLVVNASDAMPHGGTLTIETMNADLDQAYVDRHGLVPPGAYVKLTVSDTGLGMDAETQAHIFEPFFTTKEQGRGTGLGLSTVYGVIKQSGGYIWVYSEPGRGTTFKIYLPRVAEAVETIERNVVSAESPRGIETILLVEDDEVVRGLAGAVLEQRGYTVLVARHSDEAFRLHGGCEGPIHLLVTDVVMPGMGGRELAERLKSSRPAMKMLYMSGYTDDAVVRHGVLEEEVAYLQKPFTPDALARKVREVLDESLYGFEDR